MMPTQNIFAQRAGMGMPGAGGAPVSTLARPVMPGQTPGQMQPQQPQPGQAPQPMPMQNNLARPVMQGQMQMQQPQMPISQAPQNFLRQRLGMMQ